MCAPILIPLAMAGAQGALSIMGQRQQAKTQEKMQKNASIAEKQRLQQQMSASRARERQEMDAAAQKIQASTRAAREARSTGRVSAIEGGVSGVSVNALLNDMSRKEAEYSFAITQQQEMDATNREIAFTDAGMQTRMNLLSINKPIEQPDYLGAVLGVVSSGLGAMKTGAGAKK